MEVGGSCSKFQTRVEVYVSLITLVEVTEAIELIWKLLGVYKTCGVGGSLLGYMEARGSFHRIWSWRPQFVEVMEASTSTICEYSHLLLSTCTEASTTSNGNFRVFGRKGK